MTQLLSIHIIYYAELSEMCDFVELLISRWNGLFLLSCCASRLLIVLYLDTWGPLHEMHALGGDSLSLASALSQSMNPQGMSNCLGGERGSHHCCCAGPALSPASGWAALLHWAVSWAVEQDRAKTWKVPDCERACVCSRGNIFPGKGKNF